MVQMTKRVLSIIPARGGSKGILRKNIIDLAGKPLIAWSIEASQASVYINTTVVSSDDEEILDIAKKLGAKILKRPALLATDEADSQSVVLHTLETLRERGEEYDYIILLQPTSPLRTSQDIDEAFDTLLESSATALISVMEIDNKILKAFKKNTEGFIEGVANNHYPFMRRQELPETYLSNGAIYIIEIEAFMREKSFLTDKTISYCMSSVKSLDIDTLEDLIKVENVI